MSLHASRLSGEQITDEIGRLPDVETTTLATGRVFSFTRSRVDLGERGGEVVREYMTHPGAVAILALRPALDGAGDEVLVIKQYRHALGVREWELPAGLLDVDGESPHIGAARELIEESDVKAHTWHTLGQFAPSAGASTEAIRLYLARDLEDVPRSERFEREDEEADIEVAWVDLDELHAAVLAGRLANGPLLVGVLTAHAARARGWETLAPADAPFPLHPDFRDGRDS